MSGYQFQLFQNRQWISGVPKTENLREEDFGEMIKIDTEINCIWESVGLVWADSLPSPTTAHQHLVRFDRPSHLHIVYS